MTYPIFPTSSRSSQHVSPKPTEHQSTQEFLRGTLDSVASREGRPPFHSVKMNGWTRGCQDEKGMGTMQQRSRGHLSRKTSKPAQHAQQQRRRNVMEMRPKKQKTIRIIRFTLMRNVSNCSPCYWDRTQIQN